MRPVILFQNFFDVPEGKKKIGVSNPAYLSSPTPNVGGGGRSHPFFKTPTFLGYFCPNPNQNFSLEKFPTKIWAHLLPMRYSAFAF